MGFNCTMVYPQNQSLIIGWQNKTFHSSLGTPQNNPVVQNKKSFHYRPNRRPNQLHAVLTAMYLSKSATKFPSLGKVARTHSQSIRSLTVSLGSGVFDWTDKKPLFSAQVLVGVSIVESILVLVLVEDTACHLNQHPMFLGFRVFSIAQEFRFAVPGPRINSSRSSTTRLTPQTSDPESQIPLITEYRLSHYVKHLLI